MPEPKRILAIDDSKSVLFLVERALVPRHHLITAATGEEGLKALAEHPFDLVILDILLPGIDGYEVLRRIRSNPDHKNLPVIFLTARSTPEDVQKGLTSGANDYLPKPFSLVELQARVENHLRLREMNLLMAHLERLRTAKGLAVTLRHEIINTMANISALNSTLALRKGEEEENRRIEENIRRVLELLDRIEELDIVDFEPYTSSLPEHMLKL